MVAGCLTGHREWPLTDADKSQGKRLKWALAHWELALIDQDYDSQRPKLFCKVLHEAVHAPFRGFNRAQYSVLEASILISRLHMLPWSKVESEIDYLRIGLDKTAGENEREAWEWLMQAVEEFKQDNPDRLGCI